MATPFCIEVLGGNPYAM